MNGILLTKNDTFIIGQVAWLLGKIMEVIFAAIDAIGIPNIGLTIILFTVIVNFLMLPLTIKQQKFAKLSAKMNPEMQAIQAKYKNKKDQESQMAMNMEMQALYAKYGVSPTGSCAYLLIQMPILLALYRVIYAVPAYVTKIGDTFRVLADKIISIDNGAFLQNSGVSSIDTIVKTYGKSIPTNIQNGIVDVLYKLSSADMQTIAAHYDLNNLTYNGQLILSNDSTRGLIDVYNNFLGMNIGNSPSYMVKEAMAAGKWIMVIVAFIIPVLSAVTQWINVKLVPQQNNSSNDNEQAQAMADSMKTMNMVMPFISALFSYSLPSGMGLYWISNSVVRSIQQVIINKHIDKMNFDEIISKNSEKSAKKMEKLKANQEKLGSYANMNTKNIQNKANISSKNTPSVGNSGTAKKGSMMSKANMVKEYNEKNNK